MKSGKKYKLIASFLIPLVMSSSILAVKPSKVFADSKTEYLLMRLAYDVSQEDVDQKKRESDQAKAEATKYAMQAESLRTEAGSLKGELEKLNGLSEEQNKQYQEISKELAAALIEKGEALDAYIAAEQNLEDTKLQFSERISTMFQFQNKSTLEVLLESDSIAGFFTNIEMISLIAQADDQAIDQMQIALDEAQLASEYALQHANDMQEIADEKIAQLKELEERIGKTTAALEDVNTRIAAADQREAELENYANSLDQQIVDLQNQLYAQQEAERKRQEEEAERARREAEATSTVPSETQSSADPSDPTEATAAAAASTPTPAPTATPAPTKDRSHAGTLSWPTWVHTVTSPFGLREHPVYHDQRYHSGIDIGAYMGDSCMAAAGGTVIEVSLPCPGENTGGSGYGNYIVIDHGNGLSTLYAHLRNVYVSTGDYVSCGQQIGEVGSTGTSTAAHLHFEVRVYGERVDPESYLP